MDDGIGRSGVRLMALTFFGIGALGVLVFWNSETEMLKWTASGVILGAALLLLGLVISLTRRTAIKFEAEPKPVVVQPVARSPPAAAPIWEANPEPVVASKPVVQVAPAPAFDAEPDGRAHLRERYTQNTQLVKEILNPNTEAPRVPRVVAQRWTPRMGDATPVGMTRGRCGQCQSIVVAPTARPLDLACPVCEKVTRLKP